MSEDGRRYWERHAKNYDRSMAVLGRRLTRMVELTAEAVRGASKVLEVAAGTGLVTRAIAKTPDEILATDYAAAMVEALRERVRSDGLSNVRCEQVDLYSLPFEPEAFDAVIAANVLHLVPDLDGALAALQRVVRPRWVRHRAPVLPRRDRSLSDGVSDSVSDGISGIPALQG